MKQKKYHFIGVGGIGMSGLARILAQKEVEVSGSDLADNAMTQALGKMGVTIHQEHRAETTTPDMTVIYSTGIPQENEEYQAAIQHKCTLWHRSDLLHHLMQQQKPLAVAGTHGKTTVSSLLAAALVEAQCDPSYVVGGVLAQFQTNAALGSGKYFVAEADESDGTFTKYFPYGGIVTNIDRDHMNHFGTEEALFAAFRTFFSQVTSAEHLFWCGDDLHLQRMQPPGISYGFGENCQWRISNFRQEGWSIIFDAKHKGISYSDIQVALTGKHNALNALAVFALTQQLGADEEAIRAAFQKFQGVGRRCEKKGEKRNVLFLDDYAHHPTEIEATLKAIRNSVPKRRLIAVFQPHRYTRTQENLGSFDAIFDPADQVIITDIYRAGEALIPGISHASIMQEVENSRYLARAEIAQQLAQELQEGDVVVSLGAGDITHLAKELIGCL